MSTPHSVTTNTNFLSRINQHIPVPLNLYSFVYLFSGASARMTGAFLTSPLDTLKARVQFSQKSAEVRQFGSTLQTAQHMLYKEGVSSFYRGLPARLVYIGPASAISFLFYEQFRHLFHKPKNSTSDYFEAILPLTAAGLLRVVGTTLRTPFDIVRQRMQVMGGLKNYSKQAIKSLSNEGASASTSNVNTHGLYKNSYQAMRGVAHKEGLRALFSGLGVTILRDIPFSVIYFLAYESSKAVQQYFHQGSEANNKLGPVNHMLSGAFAAACGVCVSNPLDVVKTRLQTQGSLEHKRYNGIIHCMKTIVAEDGLKGFTRGLVPRMLYLCPSAAITFSLYEGFKKIYASAWGGDPNFVKGLGPHNKATNKH